MDSVVLVHGDDTLIDLGGWTMRYYANDWLPANGFAPVLLDLDSPSPTVRAQQIADAIAQIEGPVHIVATASGGLVARHYMKFMGGAARVTSCSMLDTSQYGRTDVWKTSPYYATSAFIRNLNEGDDTPGPALYLQVRARLTQRVLDGGVWLFDCPAEWGANHTNIQTNESVFREAVLPTLLGTPAGSFVELAVT